jgi:hypothetical protein
LGIGLIARIFVITRSFGGAMIALGVGLGIIYPLMVCLTYGFVNVGMQQSFAGIVAPAVSTVSMVSWALDPSTVSSAAISMLLGTSPVFASVPAPMTAAQLGGWFWGMVNYLAFVSAGLVLIPFINFLIVDVFIIDFSQAIGERMDFMRLLTGIV